ncbi:hypothetical protein [Chloracidobacterium aggregatum]|uniref:hypothetical protein n=1 Tax=Chloracidobacterium aggregatum TaxID=2851959 RepID=UPI001B8C226A|nr:hypothetical protein [Chloracidobacterium aggregatum]QUV86262.1 hypothetical protein J8C03_11430 [Chloracidobacterium sp. 2]
MLTTRKRLAGRADWSLPLMDEGEDERSWIASAEPVTLAAHSRHVRDEIQRTVRALPLNIREEVFLAAAEAHDWARRMNASRRFCSVLTGRKPGCWGLPRWVCWPSRTACH